MIAVRLTRNNLARSAQGNACDGERDREGHGHESARSYSRSRGVCQLFEKAADDEGVGVVAMIVLVVELLRRCRGQIISARRSPVRPALSTRGRRF